MTKFSKKMSIFNKIFIPLKHQPSETRIAGEREREREIYQLKNFEFLTLASRNIVGYKGFLFYKL